MAKAKKTNPSTKRSPAAQALWRWLRTAGTYLRIFVRGIVYLLWSKSWIVFTPLGVLLAVFLFSYSPSDPAFTFTTDAQASNWGGVVGAWVSDCLLSAFGFSAWWFVLASFMSAVFAFRSEWRRSRGERDPERLRPPKLSSAFGFVVLLVGSSSLEALRLRRFETSLPGNPGGVLGDWLAFAVEHYIGVGLATVVFFVLIGMGLSLLMDFEWMSVCERVGRLLDFLIFEPIGKLLNRKKEEKPAEAPAEAEPLPRAEPIDEETAHVPIFAGLHNVSPEGGEDALAPAPAEERAPEAQPPKKEVSSRTKPAATASRNTTAVMVLRRLMAHTPLRS